MDDSKWKLIEKSLDKIPSLSPVVSKVVNIANDINASPRDLMKVISLDPILTGKVLKLVNSAYFGIRSEITSLNRALIQLGVNTIKNLALSTAVMGALEVKEKNPPIKIDEFWKHSIGVAAGAKILARNLGTPENQLEEFFICGLLHDLGKIPMLRFFPEDFKAAMTISEQRDVNLCEAEELHYTTSHVIIGAALAERWRLLGAPKFVIAHHHDPLRPSDHKHINQLIFIANNYCKLNSVGISGNLFVEPMYDMVLNLLEIGTEQVDEWFEDLSIEIMKAKVFLNIAAKS